MNLDLNIGELVTFIEEYKNTIMLDNKELDIRDLDCSVKTPSGMSRINYVIKKENLKGIKITLCNGVEIKCANKHILQKNGNDIYASFLKPGDAVDTISGPVVIDNITELSDTTFYDIGIDSPHLYYDSDGVVHHNTLITAALSYSCESIGRSIVIVPNKSLVAQTETDYRNLGLDVGVYFGERKEYNKTHTICTWQSLNNMLKNTKSGEAEVDIKDFLEGVVCVIIDEAHSCKADALKTLLTGVMAEVPIRWGLTGTIPKEKFESQALMVSIGPVINKLAAKDLQDMGVLASCHVNVIQLQDNVEYRDYQSELKHLLENKARLDKVAQLIKQISLEGNTLVLVDRVNAGRELITRIPDSVFISGETKLAARKEEYDEVASLDGKILVCTYGVAAVGINIPRIFNVILIEPGKSFVRVIQSIGRGLRKASDKDFVQIWDITSNCKFSKRHLTQRKTFYRDAGYPFEVEKLEYLGESKLKF